MYVLGIFNVLRYLIKLASQIAVDICSLMFFSCLNNLKMKRTDCRERGLANPETAFGSANILIGSKKARASGL
jgi:hypothetical protein